MKTHPDATRATSSPRKIQGVRGGLRDPRRRTEAWPLRPLRPRGRQLRDGRRRRIRSVGLREFGDFADISGTCSASAICSAAATGGAAARSAAPICERPRDCVRGIGEGAETSINSPPETCEIAVSDRVGRPRAVPQCRGRTGPLPAGLFHRGPQHQVRGAGKIITSRAPSAGRGTHQRDRKITVKIPAGAPPASSCGSSAKAKPVPPADLPETSTSSCTCASTLFFHRDGMNLFCEIP